MKTLAKPDQFGQVIFRSEADHVISLPLARIVIEAPALAKVTMLSFGSSVCPAISGQVHVCLEASSRWLISLASDVPAEPPEGTSQHENVTGTVALLVAVILSMIVLVPDAVYWISVTDSANFEGMRTLLTIVVMTRTPA
jgi:hypothetical protein